MYPGVSCGNERSRLASIFQPMTCGGVSSLISLRALSGWPRGRLPRLQRRRHYVDFHNCHPK